MFSEVKRRATQREVAQMANVSQGVVSVVLNGAPSLKLISPETRTRVLAAAKKLNYRVNLCAQQLRLGKSHLVNIVIPTLFSHMLQELIPRIEAELSQAGYRIVISRINDCEDILETVHNVMSMDFAGTIVLDHFDCYDSAAARQVTEFLAQCSRVVFLRTPAWLSEVRAVEVNYASGVHAAIRHLADNGCRRIALALNDDHCEPMTGRRDGYLAGLAECGLEAIPELYWVAFKAGLVGLDGSRPEFIARACFEQMLKPGRADAVITSNDEWAVALNKVLRKESMRVPDEIAVIGYGDNPDLCWACEPELTSINHGEAALARALANTLLQEIDPDNFAAPVPPIVDSYLVVRQSSQHKCNPISS